MLKTIQLISLIFLLTFPLVSWSQCSCSVVGFENNNLGCWDLRYGKYVTNDVFNWTHQTDSENQQHKITDIGEIDPIASFNCNENANLSTVAKGSTHSLRLGDSENGSWAASASALIEIPTDLDLLLFQYAILFQDPGHEDRPRFQVTIYEDNCNENACGDYIEFASFEIDGYESCRNGWKVKQWTTVGIDISKLNCEKIRLEFITSDCAYGAHAGYAYIDANCANLEVEIESYCPQNAYIILKAPDGFTDYTWTNSLTQDTYKGQSIRVENPQGGETYNVLLESIAGCTANLDFTLPPLPEKSEIEIKYSSTQICSGEDFIIEVIGNAISDIYVNNIKQTKNTISLAPQSSITYNIKVISSSPCTPNVEEIVTVTVGDTPSIKWLSETQILCPNDTACIIFEPDESLEQLVTYNDTMDSNNVIKTALTQTTTFTLTVTDPITSCISQEEQTVFISDSNGLDYDLPTFFVCSLGEPTLISVGMSNLGGIIWYDLKNLQGQSPEYVVDEFQPLTNQSESYNVWLEPIENLDIPVKFWSKDSCQVITDTIKVRIVSPPEIDIINPIYTCQGDTVKINLTGDFDKIEAELIGVENNTIEIIPLTDQVINLNAHKSNCESAKGQIKIHVEEKPHIELLPSTLNICSGESAVINLGIGIGNSILWRHNTSLTSPQIEVYPNESSYYLFEVSTENGCKVVDSIFVNVSDPKDIAYKKRNLVICEGSTATIAVESPQTINVFWPHNQSDGQSIMISPLISSYYTFIVNDSLNCSSIIDSILVEVESSKVKLNEIIDTIICSNDSILVKPSGENFDGIYWNGLDTLASELFLPIDTYTVYSITGLSYDSNICSSPPITFKVERYSDSIFFNIPDTIFACYGTKIELPHPISTATQIHILELDTIIYNGISVLPDSLSTLTFEVLGLNCELRDSVKVITNQYPNYQISHNSVVCIDDSLFVEINTEANITWFKNSTSFSNENSVYIVSDVFSIYTFTLSNNSCIYSDTLEFDIINSTSPNISNRDFRGCYGDSIDIELESLSNYEVLWEDGQLGHKISLLINTNGFFQFEVKDSFNCNYFRDSIFVASYKEPKVETLNINHCLEVRDTLFLDISCDNCEVIWNDNIIENYLILHQNTQIPINISVKNECKVYQFLLDIPFNNCKAHYPSAFSPNGDNINDKWGLISNCTIESYEIKIFNRWGKVVFQSDDVTENWEPKELDLGIYVYIVEYTIKNNCKPIFKKGKITLIK